jgi:hypothetical protein
MMAALRMLGFDLHQQKKALNRTIPRREKPPIEKNSEKRRVLRKEVL